MSHFVECQTEFRDPLALVAALVECGLEESQTEVHPEAVPLYGYQGDVRPQKAHIVIRRQHVGPAANDVGWERQANGTYPAWISEYDGRHRFAGVRLRSRRPPAAGAGSHGDPRAAAQRRDRSSDRGLPLNWPKRVAVASMAACAVADSIRYSR